MAAKENMTIKFVPMTTINKKITGWETGCTEWVATEKIHGSSFQFFTNDGENVYLASRRTLLNRQGSFLKCNLDEFHRRHAQYIKQLFHVVETDDRWHLYRTTDDMVDDDEDEIEEEGVNDDQTGNDNDEESAEVTVGDECNEEESINENLEQTLTENNTKEVIELRIYGELFGGGGISKDVKCAVQKEIIYADEFRFYVFGINVNRKWMTVTEMNDLCRFSGFPYYATPVCTPKSTTEELTDWLTTSGFMKSKSTLTDKNDNVKTRIEGVVMTPLVRKDFRLHAVKFLANAFIDVQITGKGKSQKINYCTKARYLSVLSKLDLSERENTDMVVDMFIADIIKEGGVSEANDSKKKAWTKCVRTWLTADGYLNKDCGQNKDKAQSTNSRRSEDGSAHDQKTPVEGEQLDGEEEDGDNFGSLFG